MKTIIHQLIDILAPLQTTKEKMPALIPVRVVTKVPLTHRDSK